ncbi:unnamed protein product [Microthlaspi erraticum]|uniref:Reverse transcriptase Ty1/copia-type domain-containing protein n=1 Tax=Microthlaspi erraticum TaxID=1685480 RepID=A0A6D2LP80_9BRAS|nr:unnamed protein product [Microthlaspi erraticum]CAA7062235.1 unnamed protein product [Microthlaspi erraticum]
MSKLGQMHWEVVKWLLRYIKGSLNLELMYTTDKALHIQGFCDSDYSADLDMRRSRIHCVTEAVKEAIWLKGLLGDFGFSHDAVKVWSDSQSAICLSKNSVFHKRTKHSATKYHFIRDVIAEGEVEVPKVHTSRNPPDVLTKVIPVSKFKSALDMLRVTQA